MNKTYVICSFLAPKNQDAPSLVVLGSSDVETIAYQMAVDLEKIHVFYEKEVDEYNKKERASKSRHQLEMEFKALGDLAPEILSKVPEELKYVQDLYTAILYDNLFVDGPRYYLNVKPNYSFKNKNFFYAPVNKY